PFPHISSLSLNLAAMVKDSRGITHFARIKVPDTLPPLVSVGALQGAGRANTLPPSVPDAAGLAPTGPVQRFVWLEQLIRANLPSLFPGLEVVAAHTFRITRDAEVDIQELESADLLETVEEAVWRRRFRRVGRLQVDQDCPVQLRAILMTPREVADEGVYAADGPLALTGLWQLHDIDQPRLKYPGFSPSTPLALRPAGAEDIFTAIRREDLLLHHPYESFEPVVEFLRAAARDP